MNAYQWRPLAVLTALSVLTLTIPTSAAAQEHLVPLSELHTRIQASAKARAADLADIDRVLSRPEAQEAMQKAKINATAARQAVATLDDQELSKLAAQARQVDQDVQGGRGAGLLALIGLIVVIIIVIALVRNA